MAVIHGVAGEWARVKGMGLGLWPLFLGVFLAGASAATMFSSPACGSLMLVASVVYCAWSMRKGMLHVERFFKGARGEEKVAGILCTLPDEYHVFNDFLACGMHVDHVVAGPAGVFAIETKFWRDRVTVEDGHILVGGRLPSRMPLSQVTREAEAVRSELERKGWKRNVTPVLAFASDTFEAKIAEVKGVVVLNSCNLKECFDIGRVVIEPHELDRLVRIMENN